MLTVLQFEDKTVSFKKENDRVMVCLTDMAKAHNKNVGDWLRLKTTDEFLSALSSVTGIPITQLIEKKQGGGQYKEQGTWGTEDVALEFAGWCSVQFKIWVNTQIKTLLTEGTVSLKPLTPAEMLVQMSQVMLDHEQKLKAIEAKQAQQDKELENINSEIEILGMETQANAAELDRFRNGQGHWFSVLGYAKLRGKEVSLNEAQVLGRKATAFCKNENIRPEKISDPRFGTVQSYPEWVLETIFTD